MDNPEHREHWTQDTERRQTKQKTQHRKYKGVKHRPSPTTQKIQRCEATTSPTTQKIQKCEAPTSSTTQKIQKCEAPTLTNNTENTKM
jgi:hypothetical protein